MAVTCNDRDRILLDGTRSEWAALEAHALTCPVCAGELAAWKSLSVAAQELRDYTENPLFWPRVERALAEEAARTAVRIERGNWLSFWRKVPLAWQTAAAGALVLILTVSAVWFYIGGKGSGSQAGNTLLNSRVLAEVERSESAYAQAIAKLAIEAKPQIENPATPLMASYREKLLLIDNAIDDLRAQAGENPSNAHLRYQLLAMYQEKQKTLEQLLEEKR
jgi:hypothetical protein